MRWPVCFFLPQDSQYVLRVRLVTHQQQGNRSIWANKDLFVFKVPTLRACRSFGPFGCATRM